MLAHGTQTISTTCPGLSGSKKPQTFASLYTDISFDNLHTDKLWLTPDVEKLAFHLRQVSVGLIINDDFESNLMDK